MSVDEFFRLIYDEMNVEHFSGALPPVTFTVGISGLSLEAHGPGVRGEMFRCADCGWVISIAERLIADGADLDGFKATMLHEMVHLKMRTLSPLDYDGKSHGPSFAAECNRIGAALGIPSVYACDDVPCPAEYEKCNYWPLPQRND